MNLSDKFQKIKDIQNRKSKWNEITADTLKKLIDSMPRRLLEVIKAKSYQTFY